MDANKIWMDFVIDDDKKVWFSSGKENGLFYYKKIDNKLHFVGHFPNERKNTFRLFSSGIKFGKKLIFGPFHATAIAIYDISENKFTMVQVEESLAGKIPFSNIIAWEQYIYFVATGLRGIILRMDMETYSLKKYEFPIEECNIQFDFLCREMVLIDNSIYCAFRYIPKIIKFNLKTEQFTGYIVAGADGFGTIAFYNNDIWLSEKRKVIRWSYLDCTIKKSYFYPDEFGMQIFLNGKYEGEKKGFCDEYSNWHQPLFRSIVNRNKLLLLSAEMNMSLLIDANKETIEKCYLCEKIDIIGQETNINNRKISALKYLFINQYGNNVILYSTRDNQLYCVKEDFKTMDKINMQLSIDKMLNYSNVIEENSKKTFCEFFDYFLTYSTNNKRSANHDCGKTIISLLKKVK